MKDTSREYQLAGIAEIREHFKLGFTKVLLWLATGAGKTFVFCKMVKDAEARGKRCIIVVRGRKLVDQASKRLTREGVNHGVLMASHWNYRPQAPVQVCSIDTLISRGLKPNADLIIIDEAHMATSKGYKEFLSQYDNAFIVSVTATPWVDSGLSHVAEKIVHPITMLELISLGFLVDARYFAPSEPDLTNVKVSSSTKDYVVDQLEDAMVAGDLTGNIIDHWKRFAENRPTLCFAVNVSHSKFLVDRFLKAGIAAEHCDAETSDEGRNDVIRRLESGETKVVCNVGIFCTGVDIISLGAIIMARPTKSRNLFIQQAGRGTRPYYAENFDLESKEGRLEAIAKSVKPNFILLDHAGNINRHGLPTDETDVDLDGKEKQSVPRETKICKNCFCAYRAPKCPECGVEPPEKPIVEILESDEELKEVDPTLATLKALQREAKLKKRKPAWAYYKLIERCSFEVAKNYLPSWFVKHYSESQSQLFAKSPFIGHRPR